MTSPVSPQPPSKRKVIGILGGLGPYAHLELERQLLAAAKRLTGASRDQDYPTWLLCSIPETPDRTAAIQGQAEDPLPWLLWGLQQLQGADFVLIPCNTAHHYLPQLRAATPLPILDMIDETARHLATHHPKARAAILATTGTLETGLYHRALHNHGLLPVSLLDRADGQDLQARLIMEPIYEPKGLKAGSDPATLGRPIGRAVEKLIQAPGCDVLIAGCTELSLALTAAPPAGIPWVDPLSVIAETAICRAYERLEG